MKKDNNCDDCFLLTRAGYSDMLCDLHENAVLTAKLEAAEKERDEWIARCDKWERQSEYDHIYGDDARAALASAVGALEKGVRMLKDAHQFVAMQNGYSDKTDYWLTAEDLESVLAALPEAGRKIAAVVKAAEDAFNGWEVGKDVVGPMRNLKKALDELGALRSGGRDGDG